MNSWIAALVFLVATGVVLAAATPLAAQEKPFSDRAVADAIAKGVEFLYSRQKEDGSWEETNTRFVVGPTALACYAMLESGQALSNPDLKKGLAWLAAAKTDRTYELALRANVWQLAQRQSPAVYRKLLAADVSKLLTSTLDGAFDYDSTGKPASSTWDNSNSQYALLGVWAGARGGVEIPAEFWKLAQRHWLSNQNADGGWGYSKQNGNSTGTMTAGGLASLFICAEQINAGEFLKCAGQSDYKPASAGMAVLKRDFAAMATGRIRCGIGDRFYYLYAVERVGLASGYKYLGDADWYTLGATTLINSQDKAGGWQDQTEAIDSGPEVSTSFAILFLARGRHAVLFNKLRYDGDWNCRPRDMSFLTKWISNTFETTVNWQLVDFDVPVEEWHDAPILYFSGSKTPTFSEGDIDKLRRYVLQGGTIFSCAECDGKEFTAGMRTMLGKLFPQYSLKPIGLDHPLYTRKTHFQLQKDLRLSVMTNGVRPLVIHCESDLPLAWQANAVKTMKPQFQVAANVFMYATDKGMMHHRASRRWPAQPTVTYNGSVKVIRLKWDGNWNPEPLALERLGRLMGEQTGVKLDALAPVPIKSLLTTAADVALLGGTGTLKANAADAAAIQAFVAKGGTIVIDAAGGDEKFADSAVALLEDLFGEDALEPLPANSPIYNVASVADGKIGKLRFRQATNRRLVSPKSPLLQAISIAARGGQIRPALLFSREDLTFAGLVGYESFNVDGYWPGRDLDGSAYRLMRNILLVAAGKDKEQAK